MINEQPTLKRAIFQISMLTDIWNGMHTVTTYFDDGSTKEDLVPLTKPLRISCIFCDRVLTREGRCENAKCIADGDDKYIANCDEVKQK